MKYYNVLFLAGVESATLCNSLDLPVHSDIQTNIHTDVITYIQTGTQTGRRNNRTKNIFRLEFCECLVIHCGEGRWFQGWWDLKNSTGS